jgi:hypothetical protein
VAKNAILANQNHWPAYCEIYTVNWFLVDSFWLLDIDYQKKGAALPPIILVSRFQQLVASI